MNVVVALEARFDRTPDGHIWADASFEYSFWQRYLDVFEQVRIAARVRNVTRPPTHGLQADGPGVSFAPVPHFVGPWQYLRQARAVRRALRATLEPMDAIMLRVPGTLGTLLAHDLQRGGRPYGVEVVGDPHDVFARGAGVRSLTRPFFRWWYARHLRKQCRHACAAAYVTAGILQHRYPAAPGAFTTHYSSIELRDEAFVATRPDTRPAGSSFNVVLIGSLDQLYKGPDILIQAVARLVTQDLDVVATIVGDGQYRGQLEELARSHGVTERVRFTGRLPAGEAVRAELDRADVFVMPSRTEGLPKALIEAQARGLPCIGSRVGGIPELLPDEDLVPPGDVDALAKKLRAVLSDPGHRQHMAQRNLETAREYHVDVLRQRRRAMYAALRDATATWTT